MHLWPDISYRSILDAFRRRFPDDAWMADRLDYLLTHTSRPFDRATTLGHVTTSGLVISRGRVLMVYHPIIARWLAPGGHIEHGETPPEAVLREVQEETGMACELHEWHGRTHLPLDIDVHLIGGNAARGESEHVHYDLRYLLRLAGGREPPFLPPKAELATEWMPVARVGAPDLRRALLKASSERML